MRLPTGWITWTILVTVSVCTLSSATAQASTIALTVGPDPTAEIATPVRATGVASGEAQVVIRTVAMPGGCDDAVGGTSTSVRAGPFAIDTATDIQEPGQYRLCATIDDYDVVSSVRAELPLTVRLARTLLLSVRAPRTVALGDLVRVRVRGFAEVPRYLTTILIRPGGSCVRARGPVDGLGTSEAIAAGPFTRADGGRMDRVGRWIACVLVRHDVVTEAPEQVIAIPFRVTLTCTRATRTLAAARSRWRAVHRRAVLTGAPAGDRLRRLGRAIGRARRQRSVACDPRASERLPQGSQAPAP